MNVTLRAYEAFGIPFVEVTELAELSHNRHCVYTASILANPLDYIPWFASLQSNWNWMWTLIMEKALIVGFNV